MNFLKILLSLIIITTSFNVNANPIAFFFAGKAIDYIIMNSFSNSNEDITFIETQNTVLNINKNLPVEITDGLIFFYSKTKDDKTIEFIFKITDKALDDISESEIDNSIGIGFKNLSCLDVEYLKWLQRGGNYIFTINNTKNELLRSYWINLAGCQ